MSNPTEDNSPEVLLVGVKLPAFWSADAALWFIQAEAQFNLAKVTVSRTKFDHIVSVLPHEIIAEVRDVIISSISASKPYEDLKEALLQRTASSERDRLHQLMCKEELGDRKPTQMLRQMQQSLGVQAPSFDKAMFRELFLQKLPTSVQKVLATVDNATAIEKLAETADRVVEIEPTSSVSSLQGVSEDRITKLEQQIAQLSTKIEKLFKNRSFSRHPRSSQRSQQQSTHNPPSDRSQSTNRRRSGSPPKPEFCYYHNRFGNNARKCMPPCKFSSSSEN